MQDIPFDALGFDLDGTLLDTQRDLGDAVNHALLLGGFEPVAMDRIEGLIGGGAKIMLKRAIGDQGGLPDGEFRPLYKEMLSYYGDHAAVHSRPYDHVEDVLDGLAAQGIAMAVVTNKFEGFARPILETLGLADRFVAIIGGDSLGKDENGNRIAKPAPDPVLKARALCGKRLGRDNPRFAFVGDSSYDIGAGRAAGVPTVAAGYGYCDKPPQELVADAVIYGFDELPAALAGLVG